MDELERARARRRRRLKARKKSSIQWGRLLIVCVLALVVLGGVGWGVVSGVSYVYHRVMGTESVATTEETLESKDTDTVKVEQKSVDKPLYVLIVGQDKSNPSQADALFLMSINTTQLTMDIIGIPSNSKIDSRDKQSATMLNQIYAQGGIDLTKAVIEDMFHIKIPYYVIVDESAFKKTNDVLGEQSFYVEKNMEHVDAATGTKDIDLRRGFQTLNNDDALAYLRYTEPNNDNFGRVERQERFLKQWVDREQDTFSITKMWHIWRVWNHYESNISTWDAMQLMRSIGSMDKNQIHFYILPGEKEKIDGSVYWQVNPTEAQRLVGIMMGSIPSEDSKSAARSEISEQDKTEKDKIQQDKSGTEEQVKTNNTTKPTEPGMDKDNKI